MEARIAELRIAEAKARQRLSDYDTKHRFTIGSHSAEGRRHSARSDQLRDIWFDLSVALDTLLYQQ